MSTQDTAQFAATFAELRAVVPTLRSRPKSILRRSNPWLPRCLALTAEAVHRTTGKRYYDVQLLGGLILAHGGIAEMQTGEGKTLTTLLPAVAFALSGGGVHIATTNSYLAQRDCEELRPAFELLGLTVGLLPPEHDDAAKREAYLRDVTFGTGYDFGFDFLRDQLTQRAQSRRPLGTKFLARLYGRSERRHTLLQRPPACAIVDEADSVLIDEGAMPLILSGSAASPPIPALLHLAAQTAAELAPEVDITIDAARRRIDFTPTGWQKIHAILSQHQLPLARPWNVYVENAYRAAQFLHRDVDYVVREDAVHIVDPQTGRIHSERNWRDGLHQAVEWQAQVTITPERVSNARVTRQRYFQRYTTLAGMTGTARGVELEFRHFFGLSTTSIPTHRPCQREHRNDRCFATGSARDAAIVAEVEAERSHGRPVLVGTRTIRHSLALADRLLDMGIPHSVLNGVQDEAEAAIIGSAGRSGAVTIATNMAGRGTDIQLDDAAKNAGGLHVIAAEHHPSRRVDRQLAGRAGRQGDPGSYRAFISADDDLITQSRSELGRRLIAAADLSGEVRRDFSAAIKSLQQQFEHDAYQNRRQLVERDNWLDEVLESLAATDRRTSTGVLP
ncbi:MAG: translocase [Planctomycetaceae bacterium]|nr:translocase [Planctomycetaceae bacterium]